MPRIAGVDLPKDKRVEVALTYIYGIGRTVSQKILTEAGINLDKRAGTLTETEVVKIREVIDQYWKVEGELRKEVAMNIKGLMDLGSYRGLRHRRSLPVHGQRTHSNARTRKGPRRGLTRKKGR